MEFEEISLENPQTPQPRSNCIDTSVRCRIYVPQNFVQKALDHFGYVIMGFFLLSSFSQNS